MAKFTTHRFIKFINFCITIILVISLSGIPSLAAERVYFYHTDAVGTPLAMTDESGTVVREVDNMPFGEEYTVVSYVEETINDNDSRFLDKQKDVETDLHYFGARYFDAGIGRFTKTDPRGISESDLMNPQKFNRYSYSINNPYKYIDPDGREVKLTSHNVVAGFRHSALLLIPDDQSQNWGSLGFKKNNQGKWYATLSAGPDNWWNPKLKSDVNRPTDAPDKNRIEATVANPYGKSKADDTKFINTLLSNDRNYGDNLDYDLTPELQDGYNSNSFSSGLLNSVGATVPKLKGDFPGIKKPVPSDDFKKP